MRPMTCPPGISLKQNYKLPEQHFTSLPRDPMIPGQGMWCRNDWFLPQLCHSIHKFLFGELALSGSTEFPRHNQHRDAGGIQWEVVTELLDPVYANLILILRIYRSEKSHNMIHCQINNNIPYTTLLKCETNLILNNPTYLCSDCRAARAFSGLLMFSWILYNTDLDSESSCL